MKTIILSVIICFIAITSYSQTPFTAQQIKSFGDESKGLLDEYLRAIRHVIKAPASQRGIIISNVKNFFISEAKIQVVNSKQQKASYNLDTYLGKIVPGYADKYQDEVIYYQDAVIDPKGLKAVTDKNGNTTYEGDFSYTQFTCFKYKNASPAVTTTKSEIPKIDDFCDKTQKSGKFIISKKYSSAQGDVWEVRLGSIMVNSEEKIKP
jgi:hypothetical protein